MTVVMSPAEVETFTAAGNTFRLLEDGTTTAGRIGIVECTLAPGWVGPPQVLQAGDGFLVPPRTPHNARDLGPGTGEMLSTYLVEIGEPITTLVA